MTAEQRRITLGVSLIVGLSLLMAAGLTFLIEPMALDLHLSDETVEDMLAIPSVAALVVVFIAGQLGDRFGHRQVIAWSGVVFILGSAVIAGANGAMLVQAGLGLCAAAAVMMQIVGVSLLREVTGHGSAQTSAFTTYGMVFPLAFLILPLGTAHFLEVSQWRLVPVIWIIGGAAIVILALVMLKAQVQRRALGDMFMSLLFGIALAAFARALAESSHVEADALPIFGGLAIGLVIVVLCVTVWRTRLLASGFFRPITEQTLWPLLICVAIVSFVGLVTFVSIAMEFFYEMSSYEAALAIVPAQIGAVLGAKVLSAWAIRKFGGYQSARWLMLALGISMLTLVTVQASTAVWYLVTIAAVFSFMGMGALTVLNTEVMRLAPGNLTGQVSSVRTAASSIGAALGVGVLGTIVMSAVPVDEGISNVSDSELFDLAASLRIDGVLAFLVALCGWFLLSRCSRIYQRELRVDVATP